MKSEFWIEKLGLAPHPEGGFYKETFRAKSSFESEWGSRNTLTSIFYLLSEADFSAFHRIKSDELWYYHAGKSLCIYEINLLGEMLVHQLNQNNPFVAITAGSWFASEVQNQQDSVLVSCAVAPGFCFADFEMAKRDELLAEHPAHAAIIKRLTR